MKKAFRNLILCCTAVLTAACGYTAVQLPEGNYYGETGNDGHPEGYGILSRGDTIIYEGQWHNGKPEGWGTWQKGDTCYRGQWKNGLRHGRGQLTWKNGSVSHSGIWQKGLRQGRGTLIDDKGRTWTGEWRSDTLAYGTQTDSTGTYTGQFGRNKQPEGFGIYATATDNERYEGQWKNGKRQGFGTGLSPLTEVQCGHWNNGKFMGERMIYTPTRVYGIDISHYQHGGRPRRRFKGRAIKWKDLRITHLGKNTKNSIGKIDFPVSFCYIKSTQGLKITNPYYRRDAKDARKAGIQVGAYHFMSPISGKLQARWFLRNTPIGHNDLPPMLDVELTHAQIARMGGADVMRREMQVWLDMVERQTGKRPILYLSQKFINEYMADATQRLKSYRIWVARYSEYRPYVKLLYWQLTPYGRVKGIHGYVDINVFNGSMEQFQRYIDSGHTELP